VPESTLAEQNTHLTEMLRQAGLDAEAHVVSARIQTVLTNEIHHRMKNMLTMVAAVVRQSLRASNSVADAEAAIGTRLIAMSRAHDLLLRADLHSADFATVLRGATEQHDTAVGRISYKGEKIEIGSASILPMSLLLNELCTNATKYGALSSVDGKVDLSWAMHADGKSLQLMWIETGGPSVPPPARKGFGTRLIENGIPRQMGGTGILSFLPRGVEFELTVPAQNLQFSRST
jgi:two-component sensor histidine kinase